MAARWIRATSSRSGRTACRSRCSTSAPARRSRRRCWRSCSSLRCCTCAACARKRVCEADMDKTLSLTPRDPIALRQWLLLGIGMLIAAAYLFPVYWMVVSALKTSGEVNAAIPTMFPHEPTLNAFRWIFERENIARYLGNSFIIAGGATALTLLLATGASYALSRVRSIWMDAVLVGVMLSQVLPPPLLVTPMFVIFRQLDLVNTYTAVILATTSKTLPFAIIMLRTTFAQIPIEIEEAARVDGCSRLMAFLRVTLPLARVGYIVVGTLVFVLAYGEF